MGGGREGGDRREGGKWVVGGTGGKFRARGGIELGGGQSVR